MNDLLTDDVNSMEFEQWLKDNPKYRIFTPDAARYYFEKRYERKGMVLKTHFNYDELLKEKRKNLEEQSKSTSRPTKMTNVRRQHIRLGLGFVKNPDRLKQNANKTMLNIVLRNSVWKNQHHKDIYNLHSHYFIRQRKLAACWAIETLADLFGVSEKTIRRWRDELVAEGSMAVVKRYNQPDIYIMGEVDEDGNEKYYADKMDEIVH